MTSDKEWAQRRHANRRANERFDLHLTDHDFREIRSLIQHGSRTVLLERQSHRVSVHGIVYKDVPCKVVYDRKRKSIVTFMHLEPFEEAMVKKKFGLTAPKKEST